MMIGDGGNYCEMCREENLVVCQLQRNLWAFNP